MIPRNLVSLTDFTKAAKGRSQEQIIKEFLHAVCDPDNSPMIEAVSVLVDDARQRMLVGFDDKLLGPARRLESFAIPYYKGGAAGKCFREARTIVGTVELVEATGINNVVCVPIQYSYRPFGVVCFHNSDPRRTFSEDDVRVLELYVDVLALALMPTEALTKMAKREQEPQALEERLPRYNSVLRRPDVTKIGARLKDIQQERSAVNARPSSAVSVFVSYAHKDEDLRLAYPVYTHTHQC